MSSLYKLVTLGQAGFRVGDVGVECYSGDDTDITVDMLALPETGFVKRRFNRVRAGIDGVDIRPIAVSMGDDEQPIIIPDAHVLTDRKGGVWIRRDTVELFAWC